MARRTAHSIEPTGLPELKPGTENAPLEITVECRLSRDSIRGERHAVTIHPDWSVSVPHDLEAERIAVALGGYTSCLTLVDYSVPAFRAAVPLLKRITRIPLKRTRKGLWRVASVADTAGCCARKEFRTIEAAARHTRSAEHFAYIYDAPVWQLRSLMNSAAKSWRASASSTAESLDLARCVREVGGALELWHCGIRPDEIMGYAAVAGLPEPLPVSYFLGMAYGEVAPEWISEILPHRPDADTASWLVWLDQKSVSTSTHEWGEWLRFGIPRDDVRLAQELRLPAVTVVTLASAMNWSNTIAARNLVTWAKVDCFPTAAQFATLAHYGVDNTLPSAAAINGLVNQVDALVHSGTISPDASNRTRLAVLLMILGTRSAVLTALKNGDDKADVGLRTLFQHAVDAPFVETEN